MTGSVDRVDYLGGATFVTKEKGNKGSVSLGNFINILDPSKIVGDFETYATSTGLYMHEYGHYIDSQRWGPLYLFVVGSCSIISAATSTHISGKYGTHSKYWTEMRANVRI